MPADTLLDRQREVQTVQGEDGVVQTATSPLDPVVEAPEVKGLPGVSGVEEQVLESTAPATGAFAPETLAELQEVTSGRSGSIFGSARAGWNEGIIGSVVNSISGSPLSAGDLDKFRIEMTSYADKNPVKNFMGEVAGRWLSDSPLDMVIGFGSSNLGKAVSTYANLRKFPVGAQTKIDDAIKLAHKDDPKLGKRIYINATEGLLTGYLSEEILQGLGKEGNESDKLAAAIGDAIASPIFSEGLRALVKTGSWTSKKFVKDLSKDLSPKLGVPPKQLEPILRDNLKDMEEIAKATEEGVHTVPTAEESIAKDITVLQSEVKRTDLAEKIEMEKSFQQKLASREGVTDLAERNALTDHAAKVQRKVERIRDGELPDFAKKIPEGEVLLRTEADVDNVFRKLLDSDAKNMDGQVGILKNLMKARAAATGHRSLDDWLAKAKLMAGGGDNAKTVFGQTHTLLSAPYRATSFRELVHEMGHIFEFDLDNRTLRTVAKEYGVGTDNIFTRDVSERFAQDFESYVSDLAGGRDSELSGSLRKAFDKMLSYLKTIFTGLPTDPIDPNMREVFDNIFGADKTGSPIGDVDAFRKARVAVKAQRGGEELFFTPKEGEDFGALQDAKAEELVSDLNSGAEEIEFSALADKKGLANKAWNAFRKKAPSIFGAGVLTPQSLFSGLGETGKKIWESMQKGIQREAEFQSRNVGQINSAMEATKFDKADSANLAKKGEVNLGDGKKRDMSGQEALVLSMYARNKSGKYSAHDSLVEKGYQPQGTDEVITFTPEQVNEMATDTWLLENAGESGVKAAEMLRLSFIEMAGNERNMLSNRGIPEEDIELNEDYFPKKGLALTRNELKKLPKSARDAIASEDIQKVMANTRGRSHKQVQSDMFASRSANIRRRGNSTLVFQNPLESLMKHSDQQTRFEALADEVAYAKAWSNGMEGDISKFVGDDINKAISTSLETVSGGRGGDPIAGKIAGQLFKGQVLSALSFNLSPIAKQMPSLVTGLQHLGFSPKDGPSFLKQAADKGLHEEMMELFPTYQMRYLSAGQNADLHDIGLADSFNSRMLGGTDLSAAAAQGPLKGVEALAQKGMAGVRGADAAVIRSLYLGAKQKLDLGDVDFKDLEPAQLKQIEDQMSKIINETQPSYHPLTRSTSQSSSSILTRQFSMFASQPMKNFNLMMRDLQELSLDPNNQELKDRVKRTAQIIALQTALVTGSGTTALLAKDKALDLFRSDEAKEDREKYYEDMGQTSQRFWQQAFASTFGNFPVGGQFLGTMLQKIITGEGFDAEAMPIELYNDTLRLGGDVNKVLTDDDVTATEISESIGRAFKLAMSPTGFPSVFNQTAKAIAQ